MDRKERYSIGIERFFAPIKEVLREDKRVIFASLHGSALKNSGARDIDIAVFSGNDVSPYALSADLKVALYRRTGLSADTFDIFDFRNSLVHRYWIVDDSRLIENILTGHADFERFVGEMEKYVRGNQK